MACKFDVWFLIWQIKNYERFNRFWKKKRRIDFCDCINAHHKGVILGTIDTAMKVLSRDITEIKSDIRKKKMYEDVLKFYINGRIMIE